jgi:hypothetical protein
MIRSTSLKVLSLVLLAASTAASTIVTTASSAAANTAHDLWLNHGDSYTLTGQFYANETIFGVCDVDCSDLDINLYDSTGSLVSSDTLTDDTPVVVAPYNGVYSVEVIMTSCSHVSGCAAQVDSAHGF